MTHNFVEVWQLFATSHRSELSLIPIMCYTSVHIWKLFLPFGPYVWNLSHNGNATLRVKELYSMLNYPQNYPQVSNGTKSNSSRLKVSSLWIPKYRCVITCDAERAKLNMSENRWTFCMRISFRIKLQNREKSKMWRLSKLDL
jgi:hypothetical protein